MTEDLFEEDNGPVFVAYSMEDLVKSPRELYKSVKEVVKYVNSPEGKSISARFKKFGTPREARDFLSYGDVTVGNSESEFPMPSEAKSPFSSLSLPQMSELKRYIEKGDVANFERLVTENPRFLVNTGGDVASILLAGCRYNALHISAKAGQTEITRKIIELVNDVDFLTRLYGTSKEDVSYRRNNIVKSYLNTPDKGNLYTPLHFATMYGKLDVVKVLGQQRLLDRRIRNKMGKTAMESACERYSEADKAQVLKGMELALEGYYIFLTRDANGISQLTSSQLFHSSSESPSAIAGPFSTDSEANEFRNKWQFVGKEVKLSDFDKGYEKVGRLLAATEGVGWAETWRFLDGTAPIDVTSDEGLAILEGFLKRRQIDEIRSGHPIVERDLTSKFKTLNFNILDDQEDVGPSGDHLNSDDVEENSDDEFYDTFTEPHDFDDTLGSLTDRFASMSVTSPKRTDLSSGDVPQTSEEVDSDDDDFVTPPTTPPPVFVIDEEPCKIDNDLFEVLSSLPRDKLQKYPFVSKYVAKLSNLTPSDRLCWPSLDSPRRANLRFTKKF